MNPMIMNPMLMNINQNYASQVEVTEMKIELNKLKKQFKNELGCCFEFRNCVSFLTILFILVIVYSMTSIINQDHNDLHNLMDHINNNNTHTNNTRLKIV